MIRRTEWLKNAALLGVSLLVSCAIGELALRLFKPQLTYSKLVELAGTYYASSDYNTFQLKANYRGVEPSMEYPGRHVTITTSSDRFRGGSELDPSKQKILVLGDSYTFGVYVNDNETYPAILNELVGKVSGQYQVINAGYTDGWETDQQYVWLKHNIKLLQPKIIVLGIFLGNDITGIDTEAWADVDENGLPTKWISKDLFVTEAGYIKNRIKGYTTVGVESIYQLPGFRESHLAIVLGKAWDRLTNWFEKGVPLQSGEAFDHIFGHYTADFLEKEAIFLKLLGAMNELSKDNGSTFMVALLPMNVMVEKDKYDLTATYGTSMLPSEFQNADSVYYARLGKLLDQMDIPAVDIETEMKRSRLGPFFPANGEVHFNPKGHQFTAERLFNFLLTRSNIQ
jgi:lysophospholipase L1-like esterase